MPADSQRPIPRRAPASWVVALLLGVFGLTDLSASVVEDVRHHASTDNTRVVFDLNAPLPAEPSVFSLRNPDRLVLDLPLSGFEAPAPTFGAASLVAGLRTGQQAHGMRVVLDLRQPATFSTFSLPAGSGNSDRLVFDLQPLPGAEQTDDPLAAWAELRMEDLAPVRNGADAPSQSPSRDIIVAIDPGHGGRDPGAIGPAGTYEKTVVLAMSQRLHDMINDTPGYSAILTRTGDYFVGLRDRVIRARDANADFFVSIHADAVDRPGPFGSSIYALSQRGATSTTAQWLAASENEAFLANGDGFLDLADRDATTRNALLDLSMTASTNFAIDVGSEMLAHLGGVNSLHKPNVELANFAVLRSPDMPSVLVETGFISNPDEEHRLRDPAHQKRLMEAVFAGIRDHFQR